MKDVTPIRGAKKDKNAPRKPVIMKDSASSTSIAKIQYGFSEGTIWGLVDGAKSVILDGTPLEAIDGAKNFKNVTYDIRLGTNDQTYMKGFPDVSNEVGIGVELKSSAPYVRAINDTQLSAVRVRLRWNGLSSTNSENGDVSGHRIDYAIDLQTDGGAYVEVLNTSISDKVSTGYERTHRIELPRATGGWQIRIRRLTANSTSEFIRDTMYVDAIAEVIDAKFNYPNTAHMGIEFDSEIFRGIPKLEAHVRGLIIRVPTNYDPVTRTYVGMWDGLFKEAYTNNPAWVYYDIITAKRYGLGDRISLNMVDKWTVYALGVYCDQLVSDGLGGQEPRFTCNVYLQKTFDAYQVLSSLSGVFRAMAFWNGERIVLDADMPKDPVYTFSRANVIADENGICFNHTGSRFRDRHTVVKVAWDNPANAFQTEYEYVRDEKAISKYGIRVLDLSAFACTSQGQAQRAGLWALKTEQLETRQITFSVGLDGFLPQVADVVNVADELFAGRANSGRVSAISAGQLVVTLDRDITVNAGDVLIINGSDGKAERRVVKSSAGRKVTMMAAFTKAEKQNIWALETADLKLMRFRIMSIQENGDSSFNITALQHEPKKFSAIDYGADVIPDNITSIIPDIIKSPSKVTITARYRVVQGQTIATMIIDWSQVKEAVGYDVEWRKDDGNWIKVPRTGNTSVEIEGVYAGNYLARVTAFNAFDISSSATTSNLTKIKGKAGKPNSLASIKATGILFGMLVEWFYKEGSADTAYTEIEVATSAAGANRAVLGSFSYPTNNTTINGLQGGLTLHYRGRLVDKLGNVSDWSQWAKGTTDNSANKLLDQLEGQITEQQLFKDLGTKIEAIDTNKTILDDLGIDLNAKVTEANNKIAAADAKIVAANRLITANKTDLTNANTLIKTNKDKLVLTDAEVAQANTLIKTNKDKLVLTDAEVAQAKTKVSELEQDYNGNKATVTNELLVLTNKDKSLASDITTLTASYEGSEAKLVQDLKVLTDKDTSLTNQLTTLDSDYKGNKANVTRDLTALATKDTAIVKDINSLNTKTDNTNTEIATVKTAVADNKTSIAKVRTDLTATYDNLEIGGYNLLPKTVFDNDFIASHREADYNLFSNNTATGGIKVTANNDENNYPFGFEFSGTATRKINLRANEEYTLSFYGQSTLNNLNYCHIMRSGKPNLILPSVKISSGYNTRRSMTFTLDEDITNGYLLIGARGNKGDWFALNSLMLQRGNKATAWTLSPLDTEAAIDTNKASITAEATARASADETLTNSISTLKSTYEGNKATVTNSLSTLTNKDIALTNTLTALDTDYKGNKTSVSNQLTALSNKDTSIVSDITKLNTKTDNTNAEIVKTNKLVSDNKGSIAEAKTELNAKYDSMAVGGYNLLPNTILSYDNIEQYSGSTIWIFKDRVAGAVRITNDEEGRTPYGFIFKGDSSKKINIKANTEYTLSFYGSARGTTQLNYVYIMRDNGNNRGLPSIEIDSDFNKRRSLTFTLDEDIDNGYLMMSTYGVKGDRFWVGSITLQQGNKATEWTQSPLDFDNELIKTDARITSEAKVLADADKAITQRIDTFTSGFGNKSLATIANEVQTYADNDKASAQKLNKLTAGYENKSLATIVSDLKTYSDKDKASASSLDSLTASFDNLEIGGENLLPNSDFSKGYTRWNSSSSIAQSETYGLGLYTIVKNTTEGGTFGVYQADDYKTAKIYKGATYTLSWLGQGTFSGLNYMHLLSVKEGNFKLPTVPLKVGRSNKYEITFEAPYTTDDLNILIGAVNQPVNAWFSVSSVMLQKGNKATEWTRSPLDAEAGIAANDARITAEAKVSATANKATADELKTVKSNVGNNTSAIQTVSTATTTNKNAIASTKTTLEAKINNQVIGGDNLIPDSEYKKGVYTWGSCSILTGETKGYETGYIKATNATADTAFGIVPHSSNQKLNLLAGEEYTLSFFGQATFEWLNYIYVISKNNPNQKIDSIRMGSGMRNKKSITFIADNDIDDGYILLAASNQPVGAWFSVGGIQLQKGNVATTWQPNGRELSSSLEETRDVVAGVSAQWSMKLDVNGYVSGVGQYNNGRVSQFAVRVDQFYIADPNSKTASTPFQVTGGKTVIKDAYIRDASIDLAKIKTASIKRLDSLSANIGHFKSASTGARLEIKDSLLSVYDSNNKLRVRLGLW